MRNRFRIILWIIFIVIILCILVLISTSFNKEDNTIQYEIIDTIESYNYNYEERDSKIFQDTFNKLKDVLNTDIDYKLYAEYLSELFVIDLFTLNNKYNKYDVGGTEYVFVDILENYRLNVEDTLYKYIVDINSDERKTLPEVSKIKMDSIEETKYTHNEKEYDAYKVNLSWEYKEDLGYQSDGEVILIKDDDKLYVVSFKGVEE